MLKQIKIQVKWEYILLMINWNAHWEIHMESQAALERNKVESLFLISKLTQSYSNQSSATGITNGKEERAQRHPFTHVIRF